MINYLRATYPKETGLSPGFTYADDSTQFNDHYVVWLENKILTKPKKMSKTEQSLQLIQITPEELSDLIAEKVKEKLVEFKNYLQEDKEEYLTKAEVAKILKISMSSVWLWTKKGKLQSYGIEGKVFYKKSEIENSLIKL